MTGAADAGAAITALAGPGRRLITGRPAGDVTDGGSLTAPQRHVPRLAALAGRDHGTAGGRPR